VDAIRQSYAEYFSRTPAGVSSVGRAEFHCQAILFDLDGVLVQSTAGSLDQLSATRRIGHPGLASLPSMPFA
jgi:hypothetical protein